MNARKSRRGCGVCITSVLLACCSLSRASVVYVDSVAIGRGDGTSWVNAFTSFQDALRGAASADEILVAQGVYRPDQGTGLIPGDQQTSFKLDRGIRLKGGYRGCVGPDPNARDIQLFETILSGDLAENDVDVKKPQELLNESSRRENSWNVVTVDSTDLGIVLDGFTIAAGHVYYTIRDDRIIGGTGMLIKSGSPNVVNCTFRGNACRFSGGGVSADQGSAARFSNCTFVFNCAAGGSGLYNCSTSPVLTGCRFLNNYGSAISNRSGSSPMIVGCVFQGNAGGAVLNRAGSNPVMTGCTFVGNTGGGGGAVDSDDRCEPVMIRCAFSANRAEVYGGALHVGEDSHVNIQNCLFTGNVAPVGGAIFSRRYTSSVTLVNSTFFGNRATKRQGDAIFGYGKITLRNCIVRGSVEGPVKNSMLLTFCNSIGSPRGEGHVDADPCFAAAGHWDPNGTLDDPNDDFWIDGDYHLKSQAGRWEPNSRSWVKDDVTSPCIDAGDPNSLVSEEPFPNGGRINMGAYGGTTEASKSYFGQPVCETIIAGDINGDCHVDLKDLAILTQHWLAGSD